MTLRWLLTLSLLCSATSATAEDPTVVLDDFENVETWTAHPADGVEVTIGSDEGIDGKAMRLDIEFVKGGGYAVVRRPLPLELPPDYRFRFHVRGDIPDNDLEFKLIAPDQENVWWRNQRSFEFPADWMPVSIRKRHVEFAWGPAGGGEMQEVGWIELAVTAGRGGRGTVWIDQLVIETLPEAGTPPQPIASASSTREGGTPDRALDGNAATGWQPLMEDARPTLDLDLGIDREFGGLVVHWAPGRHATAYNVLASLDGETWRSIREVRQGNGGRDPLLLTEAEARLLRLELLRPASADGVTLTELDIKPIEWGASREAFFQNLAAEAPRGDYPRGYVGEQSYWTVVGVDGASNEALIGEDGRLESGQAQWSIEPFIYRDGELLTWSDAETEHGLNGQFLPLPWARRKHDGITLTVETATTGGRDSSGVYAGYTLENTGDARVRGTLYLAIRPFQVNPPQQFLNIVGGTARLRTIERKGSTLVLNGEPRVALFRSPDAFGATTFDAGEIVEHLRAASLPATQTADDGFEHASAALGYDFDLRPDERLRVNLLVALGDSRGLAPARARADFLTSALDWNERLGKVSIRIPDLEVDHTLKAQAGWVLVNRDGPAIQPGSRAYARSWIRDGSLTSTALLRLGHVEPVREFMEWFAPYQYDEGKVPCCVDHRGSDPVPEHDSSGQLIYLIAEYVRHTGDLEMAERMWPRVAAAAGYLDSLRQTRRTAEYEEADKAHFYGLLPPSISHEGYSAKPMHSYWDDLFALRGFKDAGWLASRTGRESEAARIGAIHDEFQADLRRSIERAMEVHGIDYIPGAADLGDFDATSTTIALDPTNAGDAVPRDALERTFERYWKFFKNRRDGIEDWEAMTPYEIRNIGAFVRLGWRDRANELLDWFMTLRRPAGWAHWAEVVAKDPREVRFLGDMPHTWVGSDFVRSVLDMLAYERRDELVIGAGIRWEWLEGSGVVVDGVSTAFGPLGFTMQSSGDSVDVRVEPLSELPSGGVTVRPPEVRPFRQVLVNGRPAVLSADGSARVTELPATLRFSP